MSATFGVASRVVRQHLAAAGMDVKAPALRSEEGQSIIFLLQRGRRGWRVSASAVPSAGTPPSSAQRRLIGLPNNQTPSESSKLSVVSFAAF